MHLAIDLRFYKPEAYGLAIHIRDLCSHLIPLLEKDSKIRKITLIFNNEIDLTRVLGMDWVSANRTSKFEYTQSKSRYYSFAEQTTFISEIETINPDLTFFFTFNFPILFPKKFVYQVLDLSIPKTKPWWNPRVLALLLIINIGIRRAAHTFYLTRSTQNDAKRFTFLTENSIQKKSSIVYNGLNEKYISTPHVSKSIAEVVEKHISVSAKKRNVSVKKRYKITKPYLLFVSVWRPYKNNVLLCKAFDSSEYSKTHQLVIAGKIDPKYNYLVNEVKELDAYKNGNIIITDLVPEDEDIISLYDTAQGFIAPSLSEGFGLWLVEAAQRGVPVACSDIPVFQEIASGTCTYFFDPYTQEGILSAIEYLCSLQGKERENIITTSYECMKKYTWKATAQHIHNTIVKI